MRERASASAHFWPTLWGVCQPAAQVDVEDAPITRTSAEGEKRGAHVGRLITVEPAFGLALHRVGKDGLVAVNAIGQSGDLGASGQGNAAEHGAVGGNNALERTGQRRVDARTSRRKALK